MLQVSVEETKRIARLAKLELSDAEVEKYSKELNEILGYISKIQEVDVSNIEFEHNIENHIGDKLALDTVEPGLNNQAATLNATNGRSKKGYFKTSKIVSKEE